MIRHIYIEKYIHQIKHLLRQVIHVANLSYPQTFITGFIARFI